MINNKTSKFFRGIAILMVIASHYAGWMYTQPHSEMLRSFASALGVYGVDIFFLLSGYGLVKSYSKKGIDKSFVVKRIMNSYVPYILIVGTLAIIDKNINNPWALFKLLVGYDYWFMCVLFVFYIMFIVFYRIGWNKELLLTVSVLIFSCWLYFGPDFSDFWILSNAAFLIGVYAATFEDRIAKNMKDNVKKWIIAAISFAAMVLCAFWYGKAGSFETHFCSSLFFSILMLFLCIMCRGVGVLLPLLGRFSLYAYLLHTRLFWMLVSYKESWSYYKGCAVAGGVTLVVAVLLGFVMEFCLSKITMAILGLPKEK